MGKKEELLARVIQMQSDLVELAEELKAYHEMEYDLRVFDADLLTMGGRMVEAQIGVSAVRLRLSRILRDSSG